MLHVPEGWCSAGFRPNEYTWMFCDVCEVDVTAAVQVGTPAAAHAPCVEYVGEEQEPGEPAFQVSPFVVQSSSDPYNASEQDAATNPSHDGLDADAQDVSSA